MSDPKTQLTERRKFRRFKINPGAYVVFTPNPNTPCRIVDISMDGIAVLFVEGQENWEGKAMELTILMDNEDCVLRNLPFEIISDFETLSGLASGETGPRRLGLRFGELTPTQRLQLEQFIWANKTGDA